MLISPFNISLGDNGSSPNFTSKEIATVAFKIKSMFNKNTY